MPSNQRKAAIVNSNNINTLGGIQGNIDSNFHYLLASDTDNPQRAPAALS
jgi:hypothetical protein